MSDVGSSEQFIKLMFNSYAEVLEHFNKLNHDNALGWRKRQAKITNTLQGDELLHFIKSRKKFSWKGKAFMAGGFMKSYIKLQFDGYPYFIVGRDCYLCHHGPDIDYNKKVKMQKESLEKIQATNPGKKSRHFSFSKKRNCPAIAEVLYAIKIRSLQINSDKAYDRRIGADMLQSQLDLVKTVDDVHRMLKIKHVLILLMTQPSKHTCRHDSSAGVYEHLRELETPAEFATKAALESNEKSKEEVVGGNAPTEVVEKSLISEEQMHPDAEEMPYNSMENIINESPPESECEEYSIDLYEVKSNSIMAKELEEKQQNNNKNLTNCIITSTESSSSSQPILDPTMVKSFSQKCVKWMNHGHKCLLRPNKNREKFVFLFQAEWQQRSLLLYGNAMTIIESVTFQNLHINFLCVRTQFQYMVVGFFITNYIHTECLKEVLSNLTKQWNPSWQPQYFLIDSSEAEIKAISEVCPDSKIIIADESRIKHWIKHLDSTTLLNKFCHKKEVLTLLRMIAQSAGEASYHVANAALKCSEVWKKSPQFQIYYMEKWENRKEMWVQYTQKAKLLRTKCHLRRYLQGLINMVHSDDITSFVDLAHLLVNKFSAQQPEFETEQTKSNSNLVETNEVSENGELSDISSHCGTVSYENSSIKRKLITENSRTAAVNLYQQILTNLNDIDDEEVLSHVSAQGENILNLLQSTVKRRKTSG